MAADIWNFKKEMNIYMTRQSPKILDHDRLSFLFHGSHLRVSIAVIALRLIPDLNRIFPLLRSASSQYARKNRTA